MTSRYKPRLLRQREAPMATERPRQHRLSPHPRLLPRHPWPWPRLRQRRLRSVLRPLLPRLLRRLWLRLLLHRPRRLRQQRRPRLLPLRRSPHPSPRLHQHPRQPPRRQWLRQPLWPHRPLLLQRRPLLQQRSRFAAPSVSRLRRRPSNIVTIVGSFSQPTPRPPWPRTGLYHLLPNLLQP
jgi:hypothetical protein